MGVQVSNSCTLMPSNICPAQHPPILREQLSPHLCTQTDSCHLTPDLHSAWEGSCAQFHLTAHLTELPHVAMLTWPSARVHSGRMQAECLSLHKSKASKLEGVYKSPCSTKDSCY
jgi:hypothetical protein